MSVMEMARNDEPIRRKLTRVGNSVGITLPSEVLHELGMMVGDEMELTTNDRGEIVLKRAFPRNVRPEVLELFAETFQEYENVLRTLKDK